MSKANLSPNLYKLVILLSTNKFLLLKTARVSVDIFKKINAFNINIVCVYIFGSSKTFTWQ